MDIIRLTLKQILTSLFLFILCINPFSQSYAIDIYGSGFSYLGSLEHVDSAFPYTKKLNVIANSYTENIGQYNLDGSVSVSYTCKQ